MSTSSAAASSAPKTDLAALKRKSVRAGAATMAEQATKLGIQVASITVISRILSPADYGVIAMVGSITAFANLFRDLGLSSAAIQKKDLTVAEQSNLFWVNVATGSVLTLLVASASPLVAWFYREPELKWVTVALASTFLISSFGTQHGAMLARRMEFGRRAIPGVAGSLTTLLVTLVLAVQGYSYWALVWGTISGAVATTALLIGLSPFRPLRPSRNTGLRELVRFGAHVTMFDLVNYFHRNLDNVLIGRFWGAVSLGFYSRAYALMLLPIGQIRGPINTVAYPAMSRLQDEPEAFRKYYQRVSSLLAFLSMPVAAFLYAASGSLIELLLGPKWLAIVPIFSVLAIVGFVQPTASLRGLVLMSLGRSRKYVTWGVINAVCVSIGFVAGLNWGAYGVAWGYVVATYFLLGPSMNYVFKDTPVRPRDFWTSIMRPAAASSVACALVIFLHRTTFPDLSAVFTFAAQASIFAAVYLGLFACLPGGFAEIRRIREMIASLTSRGAPKTHAR